MMSLRQRHIDPHLSLSSQRDLHRSDSDSSLSLSQVGDRLSALGSKGLLMKPTSLLHGLPNGGTRLHESGAGEHVPDSPVLMKRVQQQQQEAAMAMAEAHSPAESTRSLSSTEPETPSPTWAAGTKGNTRIPQLLAKKSPLEEDSASTGEDTDSTASRKKHTFKIFKKQKK